MLSQEMPFGYVQKGQFYCCAEVEVLNGHWWKGDTGPGWLHREKTRSGFDQTRGRCLSDYLIVAAAQLGDWILLFVSSTICFKRVAAGIRDPWRIEDQHTSEVIRVACLQSPRVNSLLLLKLENQWGSLQEVMIVGHCFTDMLLEYR